MDSVLGRLLLRIRCNPLRYLRCHFHRGQGNSQNTYFPIEKREEMIRELYKDEPRIKVMSYDCLTIDFAQEVGARFIAVSYTHLMALVALQW